MRIAAPPRFRWNNEELTVCQRSSFADQKGSHPGVWDGGGSSSCAGVGSQSSGCKSDGDCRGNEHNDRETRHPAKEQYGA